MDPETESTSIPEATPLPLPSSIDPRVALIVALLVALVAVFVFARSRSTKKTSTVLLVGPSDGGKTAVFNSLVFGHALPSHSSLQPNVGSLTDPSSKKPLVLADIPGHLRLRDQYTQFLDETKAVVFVVDCSTVARNGTVVAEHLQYILHAFANLPPSKSCPPIALLAHKVDLITTTATNSTPSEIGIARIKTVLERELDKRSQLQKKSVGIDRMGEENLDAQLGGLECTGNGPFKFSEWQHGEIIFLSSSVHVERDEFGLSEKSDDQEKLEPPVSSEGLQSLRDWIFGLDM